MKAIVLAAGEGKRMRPLTANRPKPMLPVAGVPMLERLLRQLRVAGVEEATLVVNYREEVIRDHFEDGAALDLKLSYARQEQPRGTGDAVRAAGNPGRDFLVLNGDLLVDQEAITHLVQAKGPVLTAREVQNPAAYGTWRLENGRVAEVVEKSATPPSNLVNAGIYRFPATVWRHIEALTPSPRGELELTDAVNASLREGTPYELQVLTTWLDVGRPWDLLAANETLLKTLTSDIRGKVEPGATVHGALHLGEGSVVKAGAYIEGPVWIGRNCQVGPNCYLRPYTVLCDGAKVGNACEIKASLLMENAHAAHLSYVGDSVIGARANLGAGTLVANLRHDGKSVPVTWEGQRVDSGRRKLGVILGDDVHTGINTSLNVGVVLGAGAATLPGEVVLRSRP
ncbi:MAG TPA: bifunctional sugar-1-phosphate nucleotidylyltransferase/acetyltransferase [Candidatus Thermoplasmatota archaeon]|nr:bifunctional sugar-1-phosphate nucleotidylyltransferase/acetyltransferase [Candidatus Thermoplasmatota archaeon]